MAGQSLADRDVVVDPAMHLAPQTWPVGRFYDGYGSGSGGFGHGQAACGGSPYGYGYGGPGGQNYGYGGFSGCGCPAYAIYGHRGSQGPSKQQTKRCQR